MHVTVFTVYIISVTIYGDEIKNSLTGIHWHETNSFGVISFCNIFLLVGFVFL